MDQVKTFVLRYQECGYPAIIGIFIVIQAYAMDSGSTLPSLDFPTFKRVERQAGPLKWMFLAIGSLAILVSVFCFLKH
ncbi:MAG: hypothetical protein U0821_23935 [Chloroflexota bacterium]